jgi:hypothetical protein
VSESNPNLDDQADTSVYPGVRYLANVIDSTEPSYAAARDLVGFDATPGGVAASPLCAGTKLSVIRTAGFLDLRGQVSPGGSANITCRVQHP